MREYRNKPIIGSAGGGGGNDYLEQLDNVLYVDPQSANASDTWTRAEALGQQSKPFSTLLKASQEALFAERDAIVVFGRGQTLADTFSILPDNLGCPIFLKRAFLNTNLTASLSNLVAKRTIGIYGDELSGFTDSAISFSHNGRWYDFDIKDISFVDTSFDNHSNNTVGDLVASTRVDINNCKIVGGTNTPFRNIRLVGDVINADKLILSKTSGQNIGFIGYANPNALQPTAKTSKIKIINSDFTSNQEGIGVGFGSVGETLVENSKFIFTVGQTTPESPPNASILTGFFVFGNPIQGNFVSFVNYQGAKTVFKNNLFQTPKRTSDFQRRVLLARRVTNISFTFIDNTFLGKGFGVTNYNYVEVSSVSPNLASVGVHVKGKGNITNGLISGITDNPSSFNNFEQADLSGYEI